MSMLFFYSLCSSSSSSSSVAAGDRIVAESVVFALLKRGEGKENPLVRD
jgi:hypothetical protein